MDERPEKGYPHTARLPRVTRYTYAGAKLPAAFSGFVVAHVSDLHNRRFGARQQTLLDKLAALRPDMVAVTGDIIDRRRFDLLPAVEFIEGASRVSPVFYVPGNHEAFSGRWEEIRTRIAQAGARVLFDGDALLPCGDAKIRVCGLADPAFHRREGGAALSMRAKLLAWAEKGDFTLLLTHRPELFALYRACGIDLAFAGHAHGGQFRLPVIGGLYAPHQGVFPKYTSGLYQEGETVMCVSRGLGNSMMPVRFLNPPELVAVELGRI